LLCELSVMVIGMAVDAAFVFNRVGDIILMAGFAGDCLMLILKGVPCFSVVKVAYPFYRMEGSFGMARHAIHSELAMMRIGMTTGTLLKLHPSKLLEINIIGNSDRVAFDAGNSLVHSLE